MKRVTSRLRTDGRWDEGWACLGTFAYGSREDIARIAVSPGLGPPAWPPSSG